MKKIFTVAILFFIFAVQNAALADAKKHPIDLAEEKCLAKAYSTADMRNCTNQAISSWFGEINKADTLLKKTLSKEQYIIFENSKEKWKAYQLAEFELINTLIHDKGGTFYTVVATGSKREIVKQRALELNGYYETVTDKILN